MSVLTGEELFVGTFTTGVFNSDPGLLTGRKWRIAGGFSSHLDVRVGDEMWLTTRALVRPSGEEAGRMA